MIGTGEMRKGELAGGGGGARGLGRAMLSSDLNTRIVLPREFSRGGMLGVLGALTTLSMTFSMSSWFFDRKVSRSILWI